MRWRAPLAMLVAAALLVACDGDEGRPSPTSTPGAPTETAAATVTPTETPAPTSTPARDATALPTPGSSEPSLPVPFATSAPEPRRTGDPAIDVIIVAVEDGRPEDIGHLLATQTLACEAESRGIGTFLCEDGEADGTESRVFPLGSCEGYYTREPEEALANFVEGTDGLYAAVDSTVAFEGETRESTTLVFHSASGLSRDAMRAQLDSDGRISFLGLGCNSLEDLVTREGQHLPMYGGPWLYPLSGPRAPETGIDALDPALSLIYRSAYEGAAYYSAAPFRHETCDLFGVGGEQDARIGWSVFFLYLPRLYGVYEAPADPPAGWADDGWWLLYRVSLNGLPGAARVGVDASGRLIGIHYECVDDPAALTGWEGAPLTPVLTPEEIEAQRAE
ncbi:MAG: hypothetical protein WD058_09235 [Dehalococcoidia bacterium]